LLNALANDVRRDILERLRYGEATAGELADPHALSLPAISRHLRILEGAGLILRRIEGREHHLSLVPNSLQPVDDWIGHYRTFWTQQLDALAQFVEGGERQRRAKTRQNRGKARVPRARRTKHR
jgi:DNA-binding transcriptional ArsR family regulator